MTCLQVHTPTAHANPAGIGHKVKPFKVKHSDPPGKFSRPSLGGVRYTMPFICQCTRNSCVEFLKRKLDALNAIRDFIAHARTHSNASINEPRVVTLSTVKRFKSDNEGEYLAAAADLRRMGIIHDLVIAYYHELYGLTERWICAIFQVGRSMIQSVEFL